MYKRQPPAEKPGASWSYTGLSPIFTASAVIQVSLVFTEAVSGFTAADYDLNLGTKRSLTGGPTTWTIQVNGPATGAGNIELKLRANTVTSVANAGVTGPAQDVAIQIPYSIPVKTSAPSATWSGYPTGSGRIVSGPFALTVTFDEDVTGLTEADFSVTRGSVVANSLTGSGSTYSIRFTPPTTPGTSGTMQARIRRSAVLGDESNLRGPTATSTSNSVSYSIPATPPPTAVVPRAAWAGVPTSTLTTAGQTFNLTLNFSNADGNAQAVTGVTASDITASSGATVGTVTGSGATRTVPITIPTTGGGNIIVTLLRNSVRSAVTGEPARNAAGPSADVATGEIAYAIPTTPPPVGDVRPAVVSFTGPTSQQTSSFSMSLTLNAAVTGLETDSFGVTRGASIGSVRGSGRLYTVTVNLPTAVGTGSIIVTLNAHAVTAVIGGLTGPLLPFSARGVPYQVARPPDPLTASWSSYPSGTVTGGTFTLRLTWSEKVRNFDRGDIVVALNGTNTSSTRLTLVAVSPDSAGRSDRYDVTYALPSSGRGNVRLTLESNSAFATASNVVGPASSVASNLVNYNITVATIGATVTAPSTTQRGGFNVVVDFDANVRGIDSSDLTVDNTGASVTLVSGGGPQEYTFAVTLPTNSVGTLNLTLKNNVGTSTVTSSLTGPPSDITIQVPYDTRLVAAPTASWGASPAPTDSSPISAASNISLTFSEAVTGLTRSDISTVGGGSVTGVNSSGSPGSYTVNFTPPATGSGSIKLRLSANTVRGVTSNLRGPVALVDSNCIFYENTVSGGEITATLPSRVTELRFFAVVHFPSNLNIRGISRSDFSISDDNSSLTNYTIRTSNSTISFYVTGYGREFNGDIVLHLESSSGVITSQKTLGRVQVDTRSVVPPPAPGEEIASRWSYTTETENEKWLFELNFTPIPSGFTSSDLSIGGGTGLITIDSVANKYGILAGTFVITVSAVDNAQGTFWLILNAGSVTYQGRSQPTNSVESPRITFDNRKLYPVISVPGGLSQSTNSLRYRLTFNHTIDPPTNVTAWARLNFREVGGPERLSERTQTATAVSRTVVDVS